RRHAEWSLVKALSEEGEGARLEQTEVAQPAIFALQVGLVALYRGWGIEPGWVVGDSVGEIAAAHVAGMLTVEGAGGGVVVQWGGVGAVGGEGGGGLGGGGRGAGRVGRWAGGGGGGGGGRGRGGGWGGGGVRGGVEFAEAVGAAVGGSEETAVVEVGAHPV